MEEEKKEVIEQPKKEESVATSVVKDVFNTMVKPRFLETTNNTIVEILYLITDSLVDLVSRKILGHPSGKRTINGRTNYSRQSTELASQQVPVTQKASDDLDYVFVQSQQKADEIREDLIRSIDRYGQVRVADLYEKVGHKTIYSDYNFGWINPDDIHYMRNRDGYWFNLPKPVQLKKG